MTRKLASEVKFNFQESFGYHWERYKRNISEGLPNKPNTHSKLIFMIFLRKNIY